MSAINRMLTQLDARGAPRPAGAPPPAPDPVAAGTRRRLGWIAGAGVLALAVLLWAELPGLGPAPLAAQGGGAGAGLTAAAAEPPADATPPPATAPPVAPGPAAVVAAAPAAVALAPLAPPAAAAPAAPPTAATAPAPVPAAEPVPEPEASTLAAARLPLPTPPTPARIERRNLPLAPTAQARALLAQAQQQVQLGQSEAARALLAQALGLDAGLVAARQLAAVLAFEAGEAEAAEALLRAGLGQPGGSAETTHAMAFALAQVQVARARHDDALQTLDAHALRDAPAEGLRAAVLAQLGRYTQARQAYEAAARQQPDNAQWWFGLGVTLESEGHPALAAQAYRRALLVGLPSTQLEQYAQQRLRVLP
jgi:predicted negative regulator of RcsB-dependent stress response